MQATPARAPRRRPWGRSSLVPCDDRIPSGRRRTFALVPALQVCPSCGSDLVQPLRWQQRRNGELLVELRCPECHVVTQACHSKQEMEELDRRQNAGRDLIVAAYEASVTESMECLAQNLREALERDL